MLSDWLQPTGLHESKKKSAAESAFPNSQALCIPPQQTLHSLKAQASMQPCQLAGHRVSSPAHTPHSSTKANGIKPNLGLRPRSVQETLYLQTDYPIMHLVGPLFQKATDCIPVAFSEPQRWPFTKATITVRWLVYRAAELGKYLMCLRLTLPSNHFNNCKLMFCDSLSLRLFCFTQAVSRSPVY